jgi:predicted transcriptional regulator
MASVTVRIPTTAHDRAQRLAESKETTLAAVIDTALEHYEREQKLAAYNAAMECLWADPEARAELQAEIAIWDRASYDGLEDYPYKGIEELEAAGDDQQ